MILKHFFIRRIKLNPKSNFKFNPSILIPFNPLKNNFPINLSSHWKMMIHTGNINGMTGSK